MSEGIEPGQVVVGAPLGVVDGMLVESKVDEINEKNISLDALKCAIEAIGDAMAELAETSAAKPEAVAGSEVLIEAIEQVPSKAEVSVEETNNVVESNTSENQQVPVVVDQPDTQEEQQQSKNVEETPMDAVPVSSEVQPVDEQKVTEVNMEVPVVAEDKSAEATDAVITANTQEQPQNECNGLVMDAEALVLEEKDANAESKLGEDMCESGFENDLSDAMKQDVQEDATQTDSLYPKLDGPVVLVEPEVQSIDLEDEEIEVEEEIEVDDDDASSLAASQEGGDKPKKKKKLRILKKIRRAPGKLAYGALFSVGALVGGTLVGGQAVGQGAKSGAGFVADTTVKIGEGTKNMAKSAAKQVSDGAKAGGDFVVETGGKIVDGTKDTATSFVKASAGAVTDIFDATVDGTKAGANAALYGVGAVVGGTVAGTKAIGHGVVDGTKAIGHGVVEGTKAIGHGVVDGTKAIGHGVADTTKAGAKFVSDTANKAVDHVEEKARQAMVNAIEATQAGAQYAGYGKQQGNPLAIESKQERKGSKKD